MELLVAKPAPGGGASTQSEVYMDMAVSVRLPALQDLKPNSNDAALVLYLTRATGIAPNISVVEEGQTRDQVQATFKHARFYLFQDQSTIANPNILFHRQGEDFMPLAIRDTLPYFLGVYGRERVNVLAELRTARRELKAAEQRLREEQRLASKDSGRARSLLAEAAQAALVAPTGLAVTDDAVLTTLRKVANWQPRHLLNGDGGGKLDALQLQLRQARMRLDRANSQVQSTEAFLVEGDAYSHEAKSQRDRLASVGLFKGEDAKNCPLCESPLKVLPPSVSVMNSALMRLDADLAKVLRDRPHLDEHLEKLRAERDGAREALRKLEEDLTALVREEEEAARIADETARAARVVGRVSLYLESAEVRGEEGVLRADVEHWRRRVQELEGQINSEEEQERLQSALSWLASRMTRWAEELELEFSGQPYRLELGRLTVVADRDGRPVLMGQRMGGGENYLGCHLIALLALHSFFIKNGRPVPGFLVLDQPTQVYFPPERYAQMEGRAEELPDEDRLAVKRLYDFLLRICSELAPGLQIIVLDHAYLDTEEFKETLVEAPWRGDRALIPKGWPGT
ncbi:DUF3732 domain-containing protein [Corallococcus sp. AB045]|nr:DUF3732 domain-containing protein [Corallococcus sp. AB045]